MSHGHSHNGGCSCGAEGSEAPERGLEYGLYQKIDLEKLQCLNESEEGSGKTVFRAWEERGDRSRFVLSDDDEELLFNITFTGNVKLKGIIVIGEDSDAHPSEMRLFKNIPHMSFDDTGREADQVFSLNIDTTGELEYPTNVKLMPVNFEVSFTHNAFSYKGKHVVFQFTGSMIFGNWPVFERIVHMIIDLLVLKRIARFSNVSHLSIHFSKNFGAENTKIFYIGLRGEWSEAHRHEVTICNYESAANPADHKVTQITPQSHFIS